MERSLNGLSSKADDVPERLLCRILKEFEESNKVENYEASGWQVWPQLR